MPNLIPALGRRGRQISEFKASLVYKVSSRTARAIQRNPVSKKPKPTNQPNNNNKTPDLLVCRRPRRMCEFPRGIL
jgi:hypothetical protein